MEKLISRIKGVIEELEQPTILARDYGELVRACVEFLEHQGYKTIRCCYTYPKIEKVSHLVELFDALMSRNHPDLIAPFRRKAVDMSIAKKFLEARVEAGDLSEKQALLECAEIINIIFKYEKDFSFNMPLTFSMLGQANCGWITDRAIQIMNKKKAREDELKAGEAQEACVKEYIELHGEDDLGFDIDKILKNMEKMKEEHFDGKKEKRKSSA